jgi:hypothetical protein
MPVHASLRIISILVVALIVRAFLSDWAWIAVCVAFAHYFLSLLYSQRQIRCVFSRPASLPPLAGLALGGTALYLADFPLVIYFAFHHVFNEVYLLERAVGPSDDAEAAKALRTSGAVLNFFIYFVLLRDLSELKFVNQQFLFGGLAVSYGVFFYNLHRLGRSMKTSALVDNCIFEIIGLFLIGASFFFGFILLHLVFYHVVFWGLYPIPKMWRQRTGEIWRYVGMNAVLTLFFLLLSPLGFGGLYGAHLIFLRQFGLWSFIHITASFALSNAHPNWITRWFDPRYAPASA